jgi:hypothetical protein
MLRLREWCEGLALSAIASALLPFSYCTQWNSCLPVTSLYYAAAWVRTSWSFTELHKCLYPSLSYIWSSSLYHLCVSFFCDWTHVTQCDQCMFLVCGYFKWQARNINMAERLSKSIFMAVLVLLNCKIYKQPKKIAKNQEPAWFKKIRGWLCVKYEKCYFTLTVYFSGSESLWTRKAVQT